MSAENDPSLFADLDYFDSQAVRDAEVLFGRVDVSAIQEVLSDVVVQEQIALLGTAKRISEANDPEQTRHYERLFGLLNEEAERIHGASLHRIALYLANQAVARQTIIATSAED